MKVSVLIENTTNSQLVCEHGLSLLIEYEGRKILLDAGSTSAFLDNAGSLGIDLGDVDFCVLSHGHYDHSGGFEKYLEEHPKKKIFAMRTAVEEYYSAAGAPMHEIGIPKGVYPAYRENFIFVNEFKELAKGIYLVPHSTKGLEQTGERAKLYKKVGNTFVPDDFSHEMSLVFDTKKGLVVFNSCSHSGIVTIINEVKACLQNKNIYAFFGGLHMKGKKDGVEVCTFSEAEIQKIAGDLKIQDLQKLFTGHCTGAAGFEMLKRYMPGKVEYLYTGRIVEL